VERSPIECQYEKRSVIADRRTVGAAQVSRLGVVVSPRGKGVIPVARLKRYLVQYFFELHECQKVNNKKCERLYRVRHNTAFTKCYQKNRFL
jgi:hypothetical protein